MDIDNMKKHIAETAYNVGFTAKLHFASHDIIEKVPGIISFISLALGVYALVFPELSTKIISSTLVVIGISGVYISLKGADKKDLEDKGVVLTSLFNELKHLMSEIQQESSDQSSISQQLKDIENKYNQNCVSNHIMFASWFAHYKFFWEQQIGWIEEYRPFSFWRDKVPLNLWAVVFILLAYALFNYSGLITVVCKSVTP